MSSTTIYRCDVCHKEVDVKEKERICINHMLFWEKPQYDFDVCPECMEQILSWFGLKPKRRKSK